MATNGTNRRVERRLLHAPWVDLFGHIVLCSELARYMLELNEDRHGITLTARQMRRAPAMPATAMSIRSTSRRP
jgi:hypothetical protein